MTTLQTTFTDFLPPLATPELEALRADIEAHGVLQPVCVDEDGLVLDGHHRLKIDPRAPRRVIKGLSPAEKQAFVFRSNFARRNLSPDQKREAQKRMKAVAALLRSEDARKWTQAAVGAALGVAQQTVADWFASNTGAGNGSQPDARVKVNPQLKPEIAERAKSETHGQIAADLGVSRQAITRLVNVENKQADRRRRREEAATGIAGDCGVVHGDFREAGRMVADASVDLIFTDPPYLADTLDLYRDLALFASRVLRPGGWLLAYSGHAYLPTVMNNLVREGLCYGWTFCARHGGGFARFRNLRLQVGWKPIIGVYKPPLEVTWDWFSDIVSGGREKELHEWQQAEAEAAHFITRMSSPDGFVCDPFAGSGTTLAAAKGLGRRWVGFETEASHVESARLRLSSGIPDVEQVTV